MSTMYYAKLALVYGYLLQIFSFVLFGELLKAGDNQAGVGTVIDEDGGRSHPRLQVVQAERNILGVAAVKHPNFTICWKIIRSRFINDSPEECACFFV